MEGVFWWIPQIRFKGSFSLPLTANYPLSMEAAETLVGRQPGICSTLDGPVMRMSKSPTGKV
jgi:hypothetical protein